MSNRNIPFGYTLENGVIFVNESETETVKEIAQRYLGGDSLKAIAANLSERSIEYMPGRSDWNKSRIKRIVDDKRYIGDCGYPQILTERQYADMQNIKSKKYTKKDTNHSCGIFTDTSIVCYDCGGRMQRHYDKRRRSPIWWNCSECKVSVNIDDNILLNGITDLLNTVIAAPERIQIPVNVREESQKIKQLNAEISKTLSTHNFDKESLKQKMLDCIREKYIGLGAETVKAQSLRDIFANASPLTAYNRKLADLTVSEVQLKENGNISLILINGQKIEKERAK